MTSWEQLGVAVAGAVAVVGLVVVLLAARGDRRRASPIAPIAPTPDSLGSDRDAALVSRRALIERGLIAAFVASLAGVVSAFVAFVWPAFEGSGRGSYEVGAVEDIHRRLIGDAPPYVGGHGRFYLVAFPESKLTSARAVYPEAVLRGMEAGFVALSPVCTHQGCQVPYCATSGWFECPCHGSRYDHQGERRRGPAPRGLDHYAVIIRDGVVSVDTTTSYRGAAPSAEPGDDDAIGVHCY